MCSYGYVLVEAVASCQVTLLYLSTIFMYFKEKTRSSSSSRQCQERYQGQMGFYRVDNFLFIQFSQSFNLRSSVLRSLILLYSSYFLAFTLDQSPFFKSSLRSRNFLASFSNTLMIFQLFLMLQLTTLMGSVRLQGVVTEILEYFCCYSSLSNLDSKFFKVCRTFLFYSWMSGLERLVQLPQ